MSQISAVVITKNESQNIGRLLASLAWIDEVIVNDTGSSDDTVKIAQDFPNVKMMESDWVGYSHNKTLALRQARNEWILWIDADEEVSSKCRDEIQSLDLHDPNVVYGFPRKTQFVDTWIMHSGWYPGYVLRLFNRTKARFDGKALHEGLDLDEGCEQRYLKHPILHYSYPTIHSFFYKMVAYGEDGARLAQEKGVRFGFASLLLRPVHAFIKFYLLKQGFRDGYLGLIIGVGSAFSCFIKYANLYQLSRHDRT